MVRPMRHDEGDEPASGADGARARAIVGGAPCATCGNPTGIHPRWWYDGDNELVPYCEDCSASMEPERPSL